jgi:hypothetical protein
MILSFRYDFLLKIMKHMAIKEKNNKRKIIIKLKE